MSERYMWEVIESYCGGDHHTLAVFDEKDKLEEALTNRGYIRVSGSNGNVWDNDEEHTRCVISQLKKNRL